MEAETLIPAALAGLNWQMRGILIGLAFGLLALAPAAQAQTTLVLHADPVPIIEAQINGHTVRLEVDLRMPDDLILNPTVAARLGVRKVPFIGIAVNTGGEDRVRGKLARPQLVFNGIASRAFAGIFNVPVTTRADGIIGPGALPYDIITIELGADNTASHDVVLPLANADLWSSQADLGGVSMTLNFDLGRAESSISTVAANRLDAQGLIVADGALIQTPVILGLTSMVQPVRTELRVRNFPLSPALARTNAPLLGAVEPDDIVVEAGAAHRPSITLGRTALSGCASISVNRATSQMTIRCAG